jgi:hypothetical protein
VLYVLHHHPSKVGASAGSPVLTARCSFKHHAHCEWGAVQSSLDVSEHPATLSKPTYVDVLYVLHHHPSKVGASAGSPVLTARCSFKHHTHCEWGAVQSSLDVSEHPATLSKPTYVDVLYVLDHHPSKVGAFAGSPVLTARCSFKHHAHCEWGAVQSSLDVSELPATLSKPTYESGPHNVVHVRSVLIRCLLNFLCLFMSFTMNTDVVSTENYRCQGNSNHTHIECYA